MAVFTEKEMDLTSLSIKIARDLKQYVDSESGELSDQTDIPLMTGGDRKHRQQNIKHRGRKRRYLKRIFRTKPVSS